MTWETLPLLPEDGNIPGNVSVPVVSRSPGSCREKRQRLPGLLGKGNRIISLIVPNSPESDFYLLDSLAFVVVKL